MYHLFSGSFDEKDNFNISLSEYHDLDNEKSIEKLNIYSVKILNFVRLNIILNLHIQENENSHRVKKTLNLISEFFKYYSNIDIEIRDIRIIYYKIFSNVSKTTEYYYIFIFPIIITFSDNIKINNILYKIFANDKLDYINTGPLNSSCDSNIFSTLYNQLWKYKDEEFNKYNKDKYDIGFYRFCTNSNKRNCDLIEVKQDDKTFKISDYLIYNVIDLDFKCEYFNLNDISVLKTFERKRELDMIYSKDKIKTYDPKELNETMKIICNELFNEIIDYLKVINKKIIEKYKRATDLYYITLNFDDDEEAYLLTMDICDIQNKKEEAKISINIINKIFEKYEFIVSEIVKYKQKAHEDKIKYSESVIEYYNRKEKKDEEKIKYHEERIEKIKSKNSEEKLNDCFISNINCKIYYKFFDCFEKLVKINEIDLKQMIKDKKLSIIELKFIIETMDDINNYLSDFGNSELDIKDVENIFKFFKIILPYLNI